MYHASLIEKFRHVVMLCDATLIYVHDIYTNGARGHKTYGLCRRNFTK